MLLHKHQREIVRSPARYKVIRAGRRGGKTIGEIETMLFKTVEANNRKVFYIAPTQTQARDIIWESLKQRVGNIGETNEARLEMKLPTKEGGTSFIKIAGWENRENFRGKSADHITFDELDTMRNFFIDWKEIFRPTLIDTAGTANFIGTPKKENPNLRRLEKIAETDLNWQAFHFTTFDNPFLPDKEMDEIRKEYEGDQNSFKQEILAEYVDNEGALFRFSSLMDLFTNNVVLGERFLTVDVADQGNDETIFTYWNGLEAYLIERYHEQTDGIINQIREATKKHKIPMSHVAVDAIGIGAGVASSPLLAGIIGFKSSYGSIKTDEDPVKLPNIHYTKNAPLVSEYRNLRSQCIFRLAQKVNNHEVAVKVDDEEIRSQIVEELSTYQDASKGDGKRQATQKDEVKALIGRSPDISDTLIMRMYFDIKNEIQGDTTEEQQKISEQMNLIFDRNYSNRERNSTE